MTTDLLLPEGARLFHVGPPKTGSTALQRRAAAHRADLLRHGVRYPGQNTTQRSEVAAFLGRSIGWAGTGRSGSNVPARHRWDAMIHEIEADHTRRVLFGHEYAASADDEMAREFVKSIGPRTHIAITLRDYGSMLPSIWQEYNKAGNVGTFDDWMKKVIQRPRTKDMTTRFFGRHDQGVLVRRWAAAAGAENVTVIVLDNQNHDFVYNTFEQLLGLPPHLLNSGADKLPANRGMSVPEIELMRRLNSIIKPQDVDWGDYQRLIAAGAALRMLERRTPLSDEPKLQLPAWSIDIVNDDAQRHVAEIAASGVRVVGDLASLGKPATARTTDANNHSSVQTVPLDVAAQALAGMLSAASGRGWDFDRTVTTSPDQSASALPARELLRELGVRAARRVRSTLRRA